MYFWYLKVVALIKSHKHYYFKTIIYTCFTKNNWSKTNNNDNNKRFNKSMFSRFPFTCDRYEQEEL